MNLSELRKLNSIYLAEILKRRDGLLFNLDAKSLLPRIPDNFVDCIYFDPPFSNKTMTDIPHEKDRQNYSQTEWFIDNESSFKTAAEHYLREFNRILKPNGSIFIHLPWQLAYSLKPIVDTVFERANLKNEIIWTWRAWSAKKNLLQEQHHTIFWYTKSDDYTFNKLTMPRAKSTQKRFGDGKIVSEVGADGKRVPSRTSGKSSESPLNDVWVWDAERESWLFEIDELDTADFIQERFVVGQSHEAPIKKIKSCTTDTAYPWQKPLGLLERLITMTTNKGDIVLDFFAGTGTTAVAANNLGRKWLANEISHYTTFDLIKRLNYKNLVPGLPLQNNPIFTDIKSMDGKDFEFWAGYTLGGISDDAWRGRDSITGVDVYLPNGNDDFIPGEVKKVFSMDEWHKTDGKVRKQLAKEKIVSEQFGLVAATIPDKVKYECSSSDSVTYKTFDISKDPRLYCSTELNKFIEDLHDRAITEGKIAVEQSHLTKKKRKGSRAN